MASKLKTFTLTSQEPYNRHKYKLILKSGKAIIHEDYETIRAMWFQWNKHCSTIEVLDK